MIKLIDILASLLKELFTVLGLSLQLSFSVLSNKRSMAYTASFTPRRKILRTTYKGFMIGEYAITRNHSLLHMLGVGNSGYGKSTCLGINSFLHLCGQGTVIALDVAGQYFEYGGGLYHERGYDICIINFSDLTGELSDGWNPMPVVEADIPRVITSLADLTLGEVKDPYWKLSSISFLILLTKILYLEGEENRTFAALYDLLHLVIGKPKDADRRISSCATERIWTEYLGFFTQSESLRGSILSTCKAILSLWSLDNIRKITSHNSIDLTSIRKKKTLILLQTKPTDLELFKSLIALYFDNLLSSISNDVTDDDEDCYILADEAGVYRINSLPLAITQVRKARVSIQLLIQSERQLYDLYGESATTIIAGCYTRVYFTNQPLQTAKMISEISGLVQYKDEDNITRTRQLITVDEVRSIDPSTCIVIQGHHRPALVKLKPFYKQKKLLAYSQIPPPRLSRNPQQEQQDSEDEGNE